MRINRTLRLGIGVIAVALAATACGGGSGSETASTADHVKEGKLTIGIKFDQPGLGFRDKDGAYQGYDVEIAKYVAGKLGVQSDKITFKEAPSAQRETMIMNGEVDFIVASYSITDGRKEKVDFAGPYFVAGQALLVKKENTEITGVESLVGNKKLCSVKGSTPAQNVKDNYAKDVKLVEVDNYSQCIEALRSGSVDAVTTDDIILAGYAGQASGELKLVGNTFTVEKYGIGLKKGDQETRAKINDAIEAMFADGSWQKAFEATIGPLRDSTLTPPAVDRY
ncbi:glutamate ABC transporter substrate-binding protein [Nocardia sp. NBC_00508]|uniref:glutamate ABC transporter substrate-binding protein n=1 Tax=Nocardia sp. NBC_00508 TaxID=2975992 RepID=UPI002E813E0A|nr:glutamate ABC transporter substrate-binding protein [Nocardia sp. NBC_00508]WUD65459.1 glutamate ABC transporter substrate-binding protein [Nocardia sp. NBC_00508]